MKAMVYHDYGSPDNLELQEMDMPGLQDDEVLVEVRAASANWLDWHFLAGKPLMVRLMAGLFKPKNSVLGIDVAGCVESVGAEVTEFQPGDEVFGSSSHGCFAEYVCVSEEELVTKPAELTFEEAAAVPAAAVTALHALRDYGQVQSGQHVLINGASGGIGTYAVQIARAFGAKVTGVCSATNLAMVRSIGADHVIDYTKKDFCQSGTLYDLIFDAVGKRSFQDCKHALSSHGVYITTKFSPILALEGLWSSMISGKKMEPLPPKAPSKGDLLFLKKLLESGKMISVIDQRYPLNEVPTALRYLETGHARGKVVITV